MLKLEDIRQDDSGDWFINITNEIGFVLGDQDNPPTENILKLAEDIISKLDRLVVESLDYIDIWVDRNRPGVGRKYELYTVFMMPEGKEVKLIFHFPEDEMSEWWVSFNILRYPKYDDKPSYWPVSFGRNQTY
ncbi:hypothetical protein B6N60_01715 [Richelia sinica FACHB-800]|uniref:Uncharacterized protein n=2 Tax=Richelia TaxID=98443 RepID=A0A975T7R8_9NOST|nr:hypothetical protein B6N60_01715 [Richelia sinica FACHB-800]